MQLSEATGWPILCPACRSAGLGQDGRCAACAASYEAGGGVLELLSAERRAELQGFLASYTRIRHAEGRGHDDSGYYRALPACPANDPLAGQWRIRQRSFLALRALLARDPGAGARVLDLGAGCGWLSHRLAQLGFRPCAIDINLDESDGLRACRHYGVRFPCIESTFDDLPLAAGSVDVVIFNASLHYSTDLERTVREAMRVLRPGGRLVILDSPIYHDKASGRQMIVEQHADFERRFGDRSDSLASAGYLTFAGLERLARMLDIAWSMRRPWYGWRWALRPALARMRGTREPATFAIVHARRP